MTTHNEILDTIDHQREDLVDFVLEFANTPSIHGNEKPASDFLHDWLEAQTDIPVKQQEVLPNRPNVIGFIEGDNTDAGTDLIFNEHLDLTYGKHDLDQWRFKDQHRIYRESWREDDVLLGDDVSHSKSAIAPYMWAAKVLQENDVQLHGDLYLTATIGEMEMANIDDYTGPEYVGGSVGVQQIIDAGVTGDFALVSEFTDYTITHMMCGVVWFKITIYGQSGYMPPLEFPDDANGASHPGAIPQAAAAVTELESWAREYTKHATQEYDHGTNRPNASVLAIRSGEPYFLNVMPGVATIYFDVRLPPGEHPDFVKGDIKQVLSDAGIEATLEPYLFHQGYIADQQAITPLVDGITDAHKEIKGSRPERPSSGQTSVWRNTNPFIEAGIPSVSYGPSRVSEEYSAIGGKAIHIDDLVDTTKIYASIMLNMCGS